MAISISSTFTGSDLDIPGSNMTLDVIHVLQFDRVRFNGII